MTAPAVLLADDDSAIRLVTRKALENAGCRVTDVGSVKGLMEALGNAELGVLVTDVAFPDGDALDLLPGIKERRPDLAIVVMSARSTLLTAVKARELGVAAYLPKPFPLNDLVEAVTGIGAAPAAPEGGPGPAPEVEKDPLIGRSPAMQDIFRSMARLVQTDLSVMITGESGTGKEVVARALHDLGRRRAAPFVAINMAAIPRELVETELFGHEKGAFTGAERPHDGRFAQASGGTLFLDEIGDMPPDAQTRLLRVLQDGSYTRVGGTELLQSDVRIIAATHKDLPALIRTGEFREDLYYRLNVVPLDLPPLRERANDIPDLCRHFLERTERDGFAPKDISPDAMEELRSWPWPGNVRELENLVWRLVVMVDDPVIGAAHLAGIRAAGDAAPGLAPAPAEAPAEATGSGQSLAEAAQYHISRFIEAHGGDNVPAGIHGRIMAEVERPLIEISLRHTGGNQLRAAEMLGLNRNTLRKKIRLLEIGTPSTRRPGRRGA